MADLEAGPSEDDQAGFMLFDTVLAFDHVQHRILIIANARITGDEDLRALYQFACAKIEFLERELERALSLTRPANARAPGVLVERHAAACSKAWCESAKEHIAAGDIYQVVLSQRFEAEIDADAFTVYRALRHVNPSPYMFFIRMGGARSSARRRRCWCAWKVGTSITHPIAGTRPRGKTEEEDRRLAEELKRNEKETRRARDAGRPRAQRHGPRLRLRHRCGSPQFMTLERYSHVMHLVSVVEGHARRGSRSRSTRSCSCFPAGTVSGAPKVRAMQIISELEPADRGIYAGAVGYLDFAGNLDFCIAIRTVRRRGRSRLRPGRRRHRRRLQSDGGVRGDA